MIRAFAVLHFDVRPKVAPVVVGVEAEGWAFRGVFEPEVVRLKGGEIVCHGGNVKPRRRAGAGWFIYDKASTHSISSSY